MMDILIYYNINYNINNSDCQEKNTHGIFNSHGKHPDTVPEGSGQAVPPCGASGVHGSYYSLNIKAKVKR